MGMDEALLASVVAGGPPTLRLYRWDGPWLSLGYSQRLSPDRIAACQRAGVGVVTRVSGGRAVLHGADLTYTIATAASELPDGLSASYAAVSRALLSALARIDIRADAAPVHVSPASPSEFDCFASAAGHEICVGGKKLAGSAQRRAGGGVLQHGSIRVLPDPPTVAAACGIASASSTSLAELGGMPDAGVLERACVAGFSEVMGASFEVDIPTATERAQASVRKPS